MALTKISHDDNDKAVFGTSEDLQIYFDGTHSRLVHTPGTGDLVIQSDDLYLTNGAGSEYYLRGIANGAVELFHNNVEMFYTSASGCHVGRPSAAAHLHFLDGGIARFGAGNDLSIFHNGTDSFIDSITGSLKIRSNAGNMAVFTPDGAVELYHNELKKFETAGHGCTFLDAVVFDNDETAGRDVGWYSQYDYMRWEDNTKAVFGSGADLEIYHSGSNTFIANGTGPLKIRSDTLELGAANGEQMLQGTANSTVNLYYDGVKKFDTYSGGINVYGSINQTGYLDIDSDSSKLRLGDGQDFQIFHNGTKNWIEGHNGDIGIALNSGNEYSAEFKTNGAVELFYDNSKKFETTSSGIAIAGSRAEITSSGSVNMVVGSTNASGVYLVLDGDSNGDASGGDYAYLGHESDGDLVIVATNPSDDADFELYVGDSTEKAIVAKANGAVELYYDGVKTFNTTGSGVVVQAPEGNSAVLYMYADEGDDAADKWVLKAESGSSQFKIRNLVSGSWEESIVANGNGNVELYYDNVKKFETTSTGSKVSGALSVYGHHNATHGGNQGSVFTQGMSVTVPAGGSNTLTFSGLNSAWATVRMGGYSSSGQSSFHWGMELGGYMTGTNMYNWVESAKWESGCNITTSKNASNFTVVLTNNASSYGLSCQIGIQSSTSAFICTIT